MIEPTKVYQPAYVSINNEADERSLSLWHVSPTEMVKLPADMFHVFLFIVLKSLFYLWILEHCIII